MSSVAAFNTSDYASKFYDVTTSLLSAFTLDAESKYVIKSIRLVNYTGTGATADVAAYDGANTTQYWVANTETVGANSAVEILSGGPLVLDGQESDELRISASAGSSVHAIITFMQIGRVKGL